MLYYAKDDYDLILIFFLCIPTSATAAVANPKGIKTLLATGLITFS